MSSIDEITDLAARFRLLSSNLGHSLGYHASIMLATYARATTYSKEAMVHTEKIADERLDKLKEIEPKLDAVAYAIEGLKEHLPKDNRVSATHRKELAKILVHLEALDIPLPIPF
jgi:hypothetical protein